MDSETVKLI